MKTLCAILATLLVLIVGTVAAGTALLLRGGISAKVEPSGVEAAVARSLRRAAIPGSIKQLRNPIPREAVVDAGRDHFADHCAICHANDGSGDTEIGRNLYPRSPDLRKRETQDLTDGELFYIIENGVRLTGMPGWGDGSEESKTASWHLVSFIRHLPRLTSEEKHGMERLNPKGPEEWREMQEDQEFLEGKEPAQQEHHDRHH